MAFGCRSGDVIRPAFLIDAREREIISWRVVADAGIRGSDGRDLLPEAVERRFGVHRAPQQVGVLSDKGSGCTAGNSRIVAWQPGLKSCFTPVKSPQSNGMLEAFVKILKRGCVRVNPLPDGATVLSLAGGRIEDCNENHPQSGLKWRAPRAFIKAESEIAQLSDETGAGSLSTYRSAP